MTVRQSHFVPPVPLVLAQQGGLLDELDVRTERTRGSAQQLAALRTGDVDVAVTAIDNLFEWVAAGADVRLVAQMERTTPLRMFARRAFAGIPDLAGARFAVDALANGFSLVARRILSDAGVEVEFVEVGGVAERFAALASGEADATLLGPPFDDMAAESGLTDLAAVGDLLPAFPGQGLVARTGFLGSPELGAFLRALDLATESAGSLSDDDGIAALERAGFGVGAATAWAARPATLRVDAAGLDLLTAIRSDLGMLPAGIDLHALSLDVPRR